ncbi:hypothetical protein RSAG8_05972, partial [Rhizoctonia solani AG-8 WAC10335]
MSLVQTCVRWVALVGSRSGDSNMVPSSAKAEQQDSDTLPYEAATLALANTIEDDRVDSLADSLGKVTVEDPEESEGGVKHEPADDESAPLIEPSIDQKGHVTSKDPKVSDGDNDEKPDQPNSEHVSSETLASDEGCSTSKAEGEVITAGVDSNSLQKDHAGVSPTTPTTTNSCERPRGPQLSPVSQPAQTKDLPASPREHENATDPAPGCGDIVAAQPGANPEQEESEYPTPKATTSVLPRATKKDETDDSLDSLVGKLSGTTLDDTNVANGGIPQERVENKSVQTPAKLEISDEIQTKPGESEGSSAGGSAPSTPCSKGEGDRYYFYTSSGLCYFDDYRCVFCEDGTLVHDGSDFESNTSFYVDGVLYWFVLDVGTEQNPNQLDPSQAPDGLQGPQDDTVALQPSLDNELDYDSHSAPPTTSNSLLGGDIGGLADLFHIEGSIDLNGVINHGLVRDELPLLKQDLEMRHYFHTPGGVHCFDDDRKLYSADGKLVYDGSSSLQAQGPRITNFHLGGSAYWFDEEGLSCRDADGAFSRVITWQIKCGPLDQLSTYQDVVAIQPELNLESSSKPKAEVPSPDSRYDSLENAFHTGLVSMSPGSLNSPYTDSSHIDTTTNPSQLFGNLPLFPASEPGYPQSAQIISRQQLNPVNVRKPTEKAQPAKKRGGNKDHLRCSHCGKQCRRPVALKEHIRTHRKEKPEICPFENCKTGFATKSNMRRHFATHRAAGTLEEYVLVMAQQPSGIQSGKVTSVPPAPHNPYHPVWHYPAKF